MCHSLFKRKLCARQLLCSYIAGHHAEFNASFHRLLLACLSIFQRRHVSRDQREYSMQCWWEIVMIDSNADSAQLNSCIWMEPP